MDIVLSEPILEEFRDVMSREEVRERFDYSLGQIEEFVRALREVSIVIMPTSDFKVVREDPRNNIIINTAYDGRSEYIVSGDGHLQRLTKFKGIRIVSPKVMLAIISGALDEFVEPE